MSIIEIDTGARINKYEYISEDIEREFNPNDIDWFGTKSNSNTVERKSKDDTLPLISVEYDSSIVEKKCKLVKK